MADGETIATRPVMRRELTQGTFDRLLASLDADRDRAAERYEELRRVLLRFFEWRGAPMPEDCVDETFDRVGRRLAEGVAIDNIGGYAWRVATLVLLEARKSPESRRAGGEVTDPPAAIPDVEDAQRQEARLSCLDHCLAALPADGRALIVGYYRDDERGRIAMRRELAHRLGINAEALANRAQRLRDKLQACVRACLQRG